MFHNYYFEYIYFSPSTVCLPDVEYSIEDHLNVLTYFQRRQPLNEICFSGPVSPLISFPHSPSSSFNSLVRSARCDSIVMITMPFRRYLHFLSRGWEIGISLVLNLVPLGGPPFNSLENRVSLNHSHLHLSWTSYVLNIPGADSFDIMGFQPCLILRTHSDHF